MKPKLLLRIATGCLLFFAVGHSIGHFTRHDSPDPKTQEVLHVMADNQLNLFGTMTTYDGMYEGMSLNLTFTLLAFIVIQWTISSMVDRDSTLAIRLLVPLSLCVLGFSITAFLFFFPVPAITGLVTFILNSVAILQLNKSKTP